MRYSYFVDKEFRLVDLSNGTFDFPKINHKVFFANIIGIHNI
jgi:hypothetical protein